MAQVLRLERRVQAPVVDFLKLELSRVRELERQVLRFGAEIGNFFKNPRPGLSAVSAAATAAVPPAPPPPSSQNLIQVAPLTPVGISGFWKVTGPTEATFYSMTDWPLAPIGPGWIVDSLLGLRGQLFVSSVKNEKGTAETAYSWSFTLQADMDQDVRDPVTYVTTASLYPPGRISIRRSGPVYGRYEILKHVPQFIFSSPPPAGTKAGWIIEGLPTLPGAQKVVEFDENLDYERDEVGVMKKATIARLMAVDGSIPENAAPVYVKGFPVVIHEPDPKAEYTPGRFIIRGQATSFIQAPENIQIGNAAPLRDLNDVDLFPEPPLKLDEARGRGFSQGSVLALSAIGPQDEYLVQSNAFDISQWHPGFKQYSNFVMFQRVIPIGPPHPYYQGQVVQIELKPTELGHLLSNMYLKLTLPALPGGGAYSPEGGRAFLKQVDLLANESTIETLYDDWYIIRDQLLLDADEQKAMQVSLAVNAATGGDVVIPLEFFFCRRHSHANKARERLRRPYFPTCAMWNQKLYVRLTFHPSTWWCNAASVVDFTNPKLITEEILLGPEEKLYYQHTPLKYIVNRVKRESGLTFTQNNPSLQLTANYPIQMMAWFFRNKTYEDPTNSRYADSRYTYGYTTGYIASGINLTFPSGTTRFVDVIETAKITLNNVDILSTFQGSLYYSFKQPMEHGLSIPSKNIYTYSFGLSPKEYNQGGYLNFAKLNSQTTTLSLTFNPTYASQIAYGYNLYLFYYGYTLLQFQGGFASMPYL